MTKIEDFFEEIGFFESICIGIHWENDTLFLDFESGVDVGDSNHPLNTKFRYDQPCTLIFEGVISSKLRVSHLVKKPNDFVDYHFNKDGFPLKKDGETYEEFYLEGTMKATDPQGWYNWDIIARKVILDDKKEPVPL